MKNRICEFEKEIVSESAQGIQNENHALHLQNCADCREALKVASFMQKFAAVSAPKRNLPTAGFVIWKSKIIEKQQAGTRAVQPIVWTQKATGVLAVVLAIWLAIRFQPQLELIGKNFSASLELVALPFLVAFVCAAFICTVIAFKLRKTPENKIK